MFCVFRLVDCSCFVVPRWLSVFCFVFPRWLFLYDSFHIIISSSVGKLEVGRGACLTLRRPVVEAVQRKGPPGDPLIQFTFNIQPIRINNIIIEIINLVSGWRRQVPGRWILKTIHLREMMMTFPGNIRQDPSIIFSYPKFPWWPLVNLSCPPVVLYICLKFSFTKIDQNSMWLYSSHNIHPLGFP